MSKFKKGQSGNPNGRPKGVSRANDLRKQLYSRAPDLIDKAIEMALEGDMAAMKLCVERILPALKAQEANIFVCSIDSDLPIIDLNTRLMEQVESGGLTPGQAHDLLTIAKLRTQLMEAEKKDNGLLSDKKWKSTINLDF